MKPYQKTVLCFAHSEGTSKTIDEEIVKPGQKTSWPLLNFHKHSTPKAYGSNSFYFKDSNVQLVQANESLVNEDNDEFNVKESRPFLSNVSKKSSLRSICSSDKASLVEIYTPRSIKCYNISNENSNGEQDANMLLEVKFRPKSKTDYARLPISLTCDDRIKNPVAQTVLNSFSLLQSKYAK